MSEDTTARDRLLQQIMDVRDAFPRRPDDADSEDILDALLARPDDLAEVAGLYTATEHVQSRTSAMETGYRTGQRETAEKIAEAIEAWNPYDYEPQKCADIARSFAGGEEER